MTDFRNSPPSRNPADVDSLAGLLRLFLTKTQQRWDDMLPAAVMAYDRARNVAQVQPLIASVTTDRVVVQRAQVAEVPVLQLGGGGFVLSFPVSSGDLGWIKANDRDISLFRQTWSASPPNTRRMHSFSDAMFIPDVMMRGVAIAPEDSARAVFQSLDGSVRIALGEDLIEMHAPSGVGIGGTPDENAIFDVQSTAKAAMPWPRMSEAQRDAIPSPREGMVVWNLDTHAPSSYDGTAWS
ncbi:MAG: hypothetical protein BGO49_24425 [Planctomycetales bacterium 71-10]|nr:MAG: hypothetical protein BGO49_24425 [Planctomycetales bacterium 71-10]